MKDYYTILGVNAAAEEGLIRAAYKVKTQLHQTEKSSGDPAEAASRMADIKEAFAVLKDLAKRQAYDAERKMHLAAGQIAAEENGAIPKVEIPELPQMRAENFSCPIFVFQPEITLEKAKALFTEKYTASEATLPDGISIESVTNSTSFIHVPSWLISGSAYGEWRATGIKMETQETDCDKCGGAGATGDDEHKKKCPACHGTRKITHVINRESTENGTARAAVEEHVQNVFAGIEFHPDFSTTAKPAKALPHMVSDLYCLQPEHDYKKAKEILNERLALTLKNKALGNLAHYDAVTNLQFGSTEVYLFNKVELWLHPFYVCWHEKRGKRQFAICDGITGAVEFPKRKNTGRIFQSILVLAVLAITIYFGKSLISGKSILHTQATSENAGTVIMPYSPANDDNTFKRLLSEEPLYEEDQADSSEPPRKTSHTEHARKSASSENTKKPVVAENTRAMLSVGSAAANNADKSNKKIKQVNAGNPSFDCTQATIKAEKLICSSKELANDDRRTAEAFDLKRKSALFEIFRKQIEFEQANWIENVRNACTDEACLLEAYRTRMGALTQPRYNQLRKTETCPIPGHC